MARLSSEIPPLELQHVPPEVLEGYIKKACLAVAGSPVVSRRLNVASESIIAAFKEAFQASPEQCLALEAPAVELALAFRHQCLFLGCKDSTCQMCSQNPNRQCDVNFNGKYLAGDILKAKCGASIFIEVTDYQTERVINDPEITDHYYVEIAVMDGKGYLALQEAKRESYDEELESSSLMLTTNGHGKPLLAPGRAGELNQAGRVVVPIIRGRACLPDLSITGSSEALLSGQKPPFMLLVRAYNKADNTRARHIRNGTSEQFVVATPRVRTAVKAVIPHVDDHVSKLQSLGVMTQNKLADIGAAAAAAGITYELNVPRNCVGTVGEFRELCMWADKDRALCETLKKVLKLTKGWDAAKEHAMQAVTSDHQLRIWSQEPNSGLIFKTLMGVVDIEKPCGVLQRRMEDGHLLAVLESHMSVAQQSIMRRGAEKAYQDWFVAGHPNWRIWDHMTYDLLVQGVHQQGMDGALVVPGVLLPTHPVSSGMRPNNFALGLSDSGSGFGSQLDLGNPSVVLSVQPGVQISSNQPSSDPHSPTLWPIREARGPQSASQSSAGANFTFSNLARSGGAPAMPPIIPNHGSENGTLKHQLGSARGSDLISVPAGIRRRGDAEHLVAERQPLASPFAGEEHQCRDPAGDMPSMPHAEPASKRSKHALAKKESEGPRRKRQALNADLLKEELSGLLGRPVSDDSLRKLFPYIPGNDSGILPGVPIGADGETKATLKRPVNSGIDLLAEAAHRESTAAQPNIFTVRSYGMPGGEVEFDTIFYREGDPYMDRFVAGEYREEDEEHVRNIAEARLSVRDLLMQPSVEGWGGPDMSNNKPSPAEAGITTGRR
ncbi:g2338 [Coccomyxa elongata]